VTPAALGLALGAAVVHAVWNLLLSRSVDIQAASALMVVVGVVVFAPVAVIVGGVHAAAAPYILASGALELAYLALLAAAYARVGLAVAYPIARGSAPVIVIGASAGLLGIRPGVGEIAGVVAISVGVVLVRGGPGAVTLRQLGWPLMVGATIAAYTLVDRYGVRHANPIVYFELTGVVMLAYPIWLGRRRGVGALRAELRVTTILAGVCMFAAYGLALAALRLAAPAAVAAVRESSVVIAAVLAVVVLHEPLARRRLAGAALVTAGIAALALT
jgi:drug/metabolite transporter (DMT)-like permease